MRDEVTKSSVAMRHRLQQRRTLPQTAPSEGDEATAAICAVVRRIPLGWVATYGQIAAMAGLPRRARLVGHVL